MRVEWGEEGSRGAGGEARIVERVCLRRALVALRVGRGTYWVWWKGREVRGEGTSAPERRSVWRAQGRSVSPTPAHTLAYEEAHQHLHNPTPNENKLTATASRSSSEIPTGLFSFLPAGLALGPASVLSALGVVSALGVLRGVAAFGDGVGAGTG